MTKSSCVRFPVNKLSAEVTVLRVRCTVGVSWIPVYNEHKLRLLGLKRSHYLIVRFRCAAKLITEWVAIA